MLPDESVNNSGTVLIAVVVPPPYLQYIFRQSVQTVLKHSIVGCAISRRVSIIQARAFSAVRGSDALFPNDFGEDLFNMLQSVFMNDEWM